MWESLEGGVVIVGNSYGGHDGGVRVGCVIIGVVGVKKSFKVVAVCSEHKNKVRDGEAAWDEPGREDGRGGVACR